LLSGLQPDYYEFRLLVFMGATLRLSETITAAIFNRSSPLKISKFILSNEIL
jgi:hypothetical protein